LVPLGIRINAGLPLIEDVAETKLRSKDELVRRLVALWAVAGTAHLPDVDFFERFFVENQLSEWLSTRERAYLFRENRSESERIHFSWQIESLYFLGWCGGLVAKIDIPTAHSSVESFMDIFPQPGEDLARLQSAVSPKSVTEILDWSDLLYRLHWAVRDDHLNGVKPSHLVVPGVVQEWHRSVNWMTRYSDEDDWDHVGTDT
jgi:hypothetical protein